MIPSFLVHVAKMSEALASSRAGYC